MTRMLNIPNKLINEKSPYLLQHAYNPVDWYPWGEEAFAKAKTEDKPIFLSIGYSCCHWCHVMEKESFEDEEVANILNNNFISIKVDREERPDIDTVYMNVCQMITGQGGWPLSIFMDCEKNPFYAGTYFPKQSYSNMIGFMELLERISEIYKTNKIEIVKTQKSILEIFKKNANNRKDTSDVIDFDVINKAFIQLSQAYDKEFGGFYHAPKFPMPHNLIFLMYHYHSNNNPLSINMVEETLISMYKGGIYDHVGSGFCRYSTDNKWLVPHFEKMLYDNALIVISYCILYALTKKYEYQKIIEDTLSFVLRELKSPEGGFYSAIDADSEGVEGKFYVWSKREIDEILGSNSETFCNLYNITDNGNFEGYNIPNLIGKSIKESQTDLIKECLTKLFNERENRIHPFLDDKILSGWNGFMIVALSMAGKLFKNNDYISASIDSANFIIDNMIKSEDCLYTSYRNGELSNKAVSESYAYVIWGLIELYEVTLDVKYLINAKKLNNRLLNNFWDDKYGGLYLNDKESEPLITRPKEMYDNAVPSANSVSCYNFIRLSHLLQDNNLEEKAKEIIKCFMNDIKDSPANYGFGLLSMLYLSSESIDIVLYGGTKEEVKEHLEIINSNYNPFCTVLYIDKNNSNIKEVFELADNYLANEPTMQICRGNKCDLPVVGLDKQYIIDMLS